MNYLITGGTGFIGYHLGKRLISEGHTVYAVDRNDTRNIFESNKNQNYFFVNHDINSSEFDNVFKYIKPDAVFHLAANSDISKADPIIELRDTFYTTYRMLNICREHHIKRFVFASSSAVFGETLEEIDEEYGPMNPISLYGSAKMASEAFINSYSYNYGIQCYILRFPNVVGDHCTHGILYDFINKVRSGAKRLEVLGDGTQEKQYIHVSELVDAISFIFNNSGHFMNVFNIAGQGTTKVKEIAEMIAGDLPISYTGGKTGWLGDCPRFKYNTRKLYYLGWEAEMTSTQAVKKAIEDIWKTY